MPCSENRMSFEFYQEFIRNFDGNKIWIKNHIKIQHTLFLKYSFYTKLILFLLEESVDLEAISDLSRHN